jgi:protein lysine acetyltransferase
MEYVRLRTGREVTIRPIRPDDKDALGAAFDQLSPLSKYRRFLSPKPYLTSSETRYLVQIDGSNHFALVATPPDRPDQILGVARFVRLPEEPEDAEIAVVVGDQFQRTGIAGELLERLGEAAVARGIKRFHATMLADNHPAHKMVRRLARGQSHERQLGHTLEIELELVPENAVSLR